MKNILLILTVLSCEASLHAMEGAIDITNQEPSGESELIKLSTTIRASLNKRKYSRKFKRIFSRVNAHQMAKLHGSIEDQMRLNTLSNAVMEEIENSDNYITTDYSLSSCASSSSLQDLLPHIPAQETKNTPPVVTGSVPDNKDVTNFTLVSSSSDINLSQVALPTPAPRIKFGEWLDYILGEKL